MVSSRRLALAALSLLGSLASGQQFAPGNLLATEGNQLFEFTPAGVLVRTISVPYPGGVPADVTDVVVDKVGRAHVLNQGSFQQDFLSTFDPVAGTWLHNPVNAFLGNVSDGDLSILQDTLYTKNESIQLPSYTTQPLNLPGGGPREVSGGLDGNLYSLVGRTVNVIDPAGPTLLRSVPLNGSSDPRGVAAVTSGDMFVADWNGMLYHFDPNGQLLSSMPSGTSNLLDIDVAPNGLVIAGGRFGEVIVTDIAFSNRTIFSAGGGLAYVGVIPPPGGAQQLDVGLISLDDPSSGPGLSANESLTVTVGNFGATTQTGFPISYTVTGPVTSSASETFTGALGPLTAASFTFTVPADMSVPGTYTVQVTANLGGDQDPTNDTVTADVLHQGAIQVFPYFEDFEADAGTFITTGAGSTWEHGVPGGSFLTAAASGTQAWATNLNGVYGTGELSYLVSPPFDCTGLTNDPVLRFAHLYQIDFSDESWVEVSVDGGPYSKLGQAGDPGSTNWYNDTSGNWWDGVSGTAGVWRTAAHIVPGAAGHVIALRWVLQGGNFVNEEGVGLDDIELFEAPFGTGQAPQAGRAVFDVNGALEVVGFPVASGYPGPYSSVVSASGTLDLHFEGVPNQPILLVGGNLNVGAAQLPGGQLDVLPFSILASGLNPVGLSAFFFTSAGGAMNLSLSLPVELVGRQMTMQGTVFDGTSTFRLTNAVVVTFAP